MRRVIALAILALLFFMKCTPPLSAADPEPSTPVDEISLPSTDAINFYTEYKGNRLRSFAITPAGSLIAGGVSRADTPLTNEPPVIDPTEYDKGGASDKRKWIHDFCFSRYEHGDGQPRLHTRGLIMFGRGDSPDLQFGRTGPDNAETTYGPPIDTEPGSCLGKMIFTAWGEGEFQGDIAGIYCRNDVVPTHTQNPGSLHLGTAGPSENDNAWRDMIDRLVISSRGYVAIGDEFPNAAERLHVKGNVLAEGNITATGDIVAKGVKKFAIDHPTRPGETLIHAAIEGPEAAVYYRGEGRLVNGRAVVQLPEYFEALTEEADRTVMLTNVDGFDRLAIQTDDGAQVKDGRFLVISDRTDSSQRFSWEVKARRADVAPMVAWK